MKPPPPPPLKIKGRSEVQIVWINSLPLDGKKGNESTIYRETAPFPLMFRGRAGVRV